MTFIEGGKYTRDKKPKSTNWIMGVIKASRIEKEILREILSKLETYPRDNEEKDRLLSVSKICEDQGYI